MAHNRTNSPDFGIPYNFAAPYLDGVYLAVNAVPDSYLIYDAHDCGYYKAEKIAANHDLFSDLMRWEPINRVVRTNLDSPDYIMGGGDKLSKKLLQVGERYRPEIIFLARSNVVIVAGHDAKPVIRDLGEKLKVPMVMIPDRNIEKDFVTGYLDAVEGLVEKLPVKPPPKNPLRVALVGYLFDRNEGDHRGNVAELRRMLAGIGAEPGPVLLDGTPFRTLAQLDAPGAVVDLTGQWEAARRFAGRCDARYIGASLPLGLEGSSEWILSIGKALGLQKEADAFVDRELAELAPMLQWLLPRFFTGKSVLVFADRLLLHPLTAFLEELGLSITAVGCTSEAYGQDRSSGTTSPEGRRRVPLQVPALMEFMAEAVDGGRADLVIGNSIIRQIVQNLSVPFVELGYPSHFHHVLHPSPYMGFAGVRVLVERMINAIEQSLIRPEQGENGCA